MRTNNLCSPIWCHRSKTIIYFAFNVLCIVYTTYACQRKNGGKFQWLYAMFVDELDCTQSLGSAVYETHGLVHHIERPAKALPSKIYESRHVNVCVCVCSMVCVCVLKCVGVFAWQSRLYGEREHSTLLTFDYILKRHFTSNNLLTINLNVPRHSH